jgi:SAM-dependent methyltransferase
MPSRRPEIVEDVRRYYREILPVYELEAISHAHLSFWRRLARRARPARILEVGSGFGRITAELAKSAPTVGIDVSFELLSRAASGRGPARFVAADARHPPFASVFDLVVAPADPLSHFTRLSDRRRILAGIARALAPGGRFVLEGLYRRPGERVAPRRTVRHSGGVLEIEEEWLPEGRSGRWRATYRYSDRRTGEPERRVEATFTARSWDPARMRKEFASCGLTIERICGDFDGRPLRADSRRLVVFSRRARRVRRSR